MELFKGAEGKSRGCGVVEFKDEEFVSKALETMNKYDLSGRPLNIKEDPDGANARRALPLTGGSFPGGHVPNMGSGLMNLPPSILNNPNIPPEVISNLQAGRLGSTIFVAWFHNLLLQSWLEGAKGSVQRSWNCKAGRY